MSVLNIKDKFFKVFEKLVNILQCDLGKLKVEKVGSDDFSIWYVYYDEESFYLTTDDLKGYSENNDGSSDKYLALIFKDKKQREMFDSIWSKIREFISEAGDKLEDYSKEYCVVSFESDDNLVYGETVCIDSLSVVISSVFNSNGCFYP